jgi:HSP20 family protein
MSDTKSTQPKQGLLAGLIILLVAIVGFQAWYMMNMKQQLDVIQGNHDTIVGMINSGSSAPANNTAVTQVPSSPVARTPSVVDRIQKSLNAQSQPQPDPQAQSIPTNPPSLFDDDFFNRSSAQNWNPYEEIERMQREMDRMFNNAFSRFNNDTDFQQLFKDSTSTPAMDVQDDGSKYSVIVNLPGADEKNISVNLDGQQLTVRGEQDFSQQKKDDMGNVIFQERHSGTFQRSITLPEPVKQNGMETHVNNGVLTITIPKLS